MVNQNEIINIATINLNGETWSSINRRPRLPHASDCQSRTIKQTEIDEYTRSILQIDTETIDTNSLIEKITVDKNAFKIIVDSTVLS